HETCTGALDAVIVDRLARLRAGIAGRGAADAPGDRGLGCRAELWRDPKGERMVPRRRVSPVRVRDAERVGDRPDTRDARYAPTGGAIAGSSDLVDSAQITPPCMSCRWRPTPCRCLWARPESASRLPRCPCRTSARSATLRPALASRRDRRRCR